jgi:Hydantoinase/oxoprolinase C-terminal domain
VKKGVPPAKAVVGRRKAIFAADGKLIDTPVYDGSKLGAGATIKGPAIIEEVTTTIVIEPRWSATQVLFRLAKFDAVNQRELDHALEMDLWELFPHDQSRRKSSLSLLRDPSGRPGPPENPSDSGRVRPARRRFCYFCHLKVRPAPATY